ncbi:MAG: hypothetical protein ACYDC1_25810 [Limisphaerales bacterium]
MSLFFQVGEGLQTVLGLEPIQAGVRLAQLGVDLGPRGVGDFPSGIVRFNDTARYRFKVEEVTPEWEEPTDS